MAIKRILQRHGFIQGLSRVLRLVLGPKVAPNEARAEIEEKHAPAVQRPNGLFR